MLRRLDPRKIGVVGTCNTLSGVAWGFVEGAFTYCEAVDKSGTYGWVISGSILFGKGEGYSDSQGLLLGIDMSSIHGLGGWSAAGDVTIGNRDYNVASNPINYGGVAVTISYTMGNEIAFDGGVSRSLVGEQPIFPIWGFRPFVEFVADCLWYTRDECLG